MKKSCLLFGAATTASLLSLNAQSQSSKPNIVLIMVDDMGYSDIGCFGSEIPTPNIDRLANTGIRYTQFYNTARSCPTRASLLTGLYPHQAGIGGMSEDPYDKTKRERSEHNRGVYGYMGSLNRNSVTLAEVLKTAGYHTYMVGKWHVGMDGMEKWPLQRGFDRFYGILPGAANYFAPSGDRGLTLDNSELPVPQPPYYTTDAFTDHAIGFMKTRKDTNPFFLYMAYNAPHWPLNAKDADIEKFIGKYEQGWEVTREARYERMKKLGIIDDSWQLAEWESRSWSDLTEEEKRHSALRMSVYAAQVYSIDYNVGKILDYLTEIGELENTLIIFFSDNGACAEPYSETGFKTIAEINGTSWIHPSYGLPWAQVSNTPFRKYKVRAYEGGISTAFIMSWPEKLSAYNNRIRHNVCFLPDIMATFVDVSGASYPQTFHGGQTIHPMVGASMMPTVSDPDIEIHDYIYGEHFDNRYVRWKNWKAVKDEKASEWELYDMVKDRSETTDLAQKQPKILKQLTEKWQQWAETHYIWPKNLEERQGN